MPTELNPKDLLVAASHRWGIEMIRLRSDLALAGSPERTAWRSVVEAEDSRLFVLEKVPSRVYSRKRQIAATLQWLSDHGLQQIVTCLPDSDDDTVTLINTGMWHGLWQLIPYLTGVYLDRSAYALDAWRGEAAADFLIDLDRICRKHHAEPDNAFFSIAVYCRTLFTTLTNRHPDIAAAYRPFMDHLEAHLFPIHDQLPMGFCHGDFHPLNIIWGEQDIRAVIDWEFCGIKSEIFDLANLLGCLGIEDPHNLAGPFAGSLVQRLRDANVFSDASWNALPDLIIAIRFAWLSEWLRKNDGPMIGLEADYMALLIKHRDKWIH